MLTRSLCKYILVAAGLMPVFVSAQEAPRVKISTSSGDIVVELYPEKAPKSVDNFLQYVRVGQYTGTIFHRVIPGFMVQGGGFDSNLTEKSTRAPIPLEANNGLLNERGTLAVARTANPNSATAQFFINLRDNPSLNAPKPDGYGYAVFGRVVSGMDVVDSIATVATTTVRGYANVPISPITITSASVDTTPIRTVVVSNSASPGVSTTSQKADSKKKSGALADSGAVASNASHSATRATTTLAAADSKERSPASTNCPVEATFLGAFQKVTTLKFAALREKMLTKAELEEYFQDLVTLQREASTNVQNNGMRIYLSYGITDTPRQRALLGCAENSTGDCADLTINREPPNFRDTITPRLAVYQCHHDAGWPSASDSTPPRGRTPTLIAATPSGGRQQAPIQEKSSARQLGATTGEGGGPTLNGVPSPRPSATKQEDDHAPYISRKCVRIVQGGKGVADAYKRIQNDCGTPVTVAFCLEAPGPINECLNPLKYGLSDVIPARKSQLTADAIQGPWTAWSFVCDMSNPKKQTCLPPKNIAGGGAFRD